MKLNEFIQRHKIKAALAVGFSDYIRRDPESNLDEKFLKDSYEKFSGRKLDNQTENVELEKNKSGSGDTKGNPTNGKDCTNPNDGNGNPDGNLTNGNDNSNPEVGNDSKSKKQNK